MGVQTRRLNNSQGRLPGFVHRSTLWSLSAIGNGAFCRCWPEACPRRICRVAAAVICGCSRSLFRCACGSFRCQKRLQCSRRRTTTVLKSRSGRAAMEGRPIVRRWRRLQRGPFVLYSWPFSSCLGLYALHEGFQSSEDSICCAGRIPIPWSGKALRREADSGFPRNPQVSTNRRPPYSSPGSVPFVADSNLG